MKDEKQEDIAYHRLSTKDEQAILNLAEGKFVINPKDTQKQKESKERIQAAYNQFKANLRPPKNPQVVKRLCYEHIPTLVDITGISYLDILAKISVDPDGNPVIPKWPQEIEEKMCRVCEIMSLAQRQKILNLIRTVLAPVFESDEMQQEKRLIMRLYKANTIRDPSIKVMTQKAQEVKLDDAYSRRYLQYSFNALELNKVMYASCAFDVSPHWLLSLSDKYPILASSGDVEMIMDLFCFLPYERKRIVLSAAEIMVTEEEKEYNLQ